ncbi:SDR family oxidoreductase [Nocardia rhamnosiphila]|uniref:SDR family oxidoreductase n=1 Tax=Nocardia rhamnosiphila TaxID=426716 RepID=UPI000A628399|nr:SDR family NAD(P)-dependent oxidoreductase [Nocardia rhamnosiphila]
MTIHGKVVEITDASGGIGEATARHLATSGAAVVLGARRTDRLDRLTAEIEAAGGRAVATRVDLTDPGDLRALVDLAVERFGRLDVLVGNAGISRRKGPGPPAHSPGLSPGAGAAGPGAGPIPTTRPSTCGTRPYVHVA